MTTVSRLRADLQDALYIAENLMSRLPEAAMTPSTKRNYKLAIERIGRNLSVPTPYLTLAPEQCRLVATLIKERIGAPGFIGDPYMLRQAAVALEALAEG